MTTDQNPTLPAWTQPPQPIRPQPPRPTVKATAPQPKPKATHTMLRFNIFAALLVASILIVIALNETIDFAEVMWALTAGACFVLLGILVHFHEPKQY